ncbi:hypothetical protein J6590_079568 [Homalodisca vitripennis]|nr:hypothetical protein J6590_079568 [Homalodisca vitripennis]
MKNPSHQTASSRANKDSWSTSEFLSDGDVQEILAQDYQVVYNMKNPSHQTAPSRANKDSWSTNVQEILAQDYQVVYNMKNPSHQTAPSRANKDSWSTSEFLSDGDVQEILAQDYQVVYNMKNPSHQTAPSRANKDSWSTRDSGTRLSSGVLHEDTATPIYSTTMEYVLVSTPVPLFRTSTSLRSPHATLAGSAQFSQCCQHTPDIRVIPSHSPLCRSPPYFHPTAGLAFHRRFGCRPGIPTSRQGVWESHEIKHALTQPNAGKLLAKYFPKARQIPLDRKFFSLVSTPLPLPLPLTANSGLIVTVTNVECECNNPPQQAHFTFLVACLFGLIIISGFQISLCHRNESSGFTLLLCSY